MATKWGEDPGTNYRGVEFRKGAPFPPMLHKFLPLSVVSDVIR
jgi:hypothetical protein